MKAQIVKIDDPKTSRNGDAIFYRVKLKLENNDFVMTDIVPTYRNFAWWRPILQAGVGTWIDGVALKCAGKINADSQVYIARSPAKVAQQQEARMCQMESREFHQIADGIFKVEGARGQQYEVRINPDGWQNRVKSFNSMQEKMKRTGKCLQCGRCCTFNFLWLSLPHEARLVMYQQIGQAKINTMLKRNAQSASGLLPGVSGQPGRSD